MNIKRTLVGIFCAFLIVIFGIGLFTPSRAKAAYQNKTCIDIQSCTDGNYDYLLSTYSDYSAEIEISAHRDINTVYGKGVATPTSKIYLTILAYKTNYQDLLNSWNRVIEDNNEVLKGNFSEYTSFKIGDRVCTLTLTPLKTDSQYYDPSFIKIGNHIFNPINLEDRTPQYSPILDLNGDGAFNVADPQFLLEFYLRSYVMEESPVSEEGLNTFRTEYWRKIHEVN